jgi:hypothetical protein
LIESPENVRPELGKIVPIGQLVQVKSCRRYIKAKQTEDLAVEKVRRNWKHGITITDLVTRGIAENKKQAQRMMKYYLHDKNILFTLGRECPQKYYPTCLKACILQSARKNLENVLTDPTEVNPSLLSHLSYTITIGKAQNLLDTLQSYSNIALHIHKLQLQLGIQSKYYSEIQKGYWQKNKGKQHEEKIGTSLVKYVIYPNGTVMVFIACSNNPFRLETESDESLLFSFFGQVRDRLLYLLSDPNERIVPNIIEWWLVGCDVNKDAEINDMMQLTGIHIQLKDADRVFRLYIKSLGDKAVRRVEESLKLRSPLVDALHAIRRCKLAENSSSRLVRDDSDACGDQKEPSQ